MMFAFQTDLWTVAFMLQSCRLDNRFNEAAAALPRMSRMWIDWARNAVVTKLQ